MELAAIIVAGYAAIVATASVVWQVYSWRHRRRSHVGVTVRYALAAPTDKTLHLIAIEATNRSEHTVRVAAAGLDLQDGGGAFQQVRPVEFATLPGRIEPFDSGTAYVPVIDAEGPASMFLSRSPDGCGLRRAMW